MFKKNRKLQVLLLSLILTFSVGVSTTIAYLTSTSNEVKNQFEPSYVSCEVTETFRNNVKTNVAVKNTGDIDAYIRAEVVVTWKNEAGEIYGVTPVPGEDYEMTLPANTGWSENGGFYYYTDKVAKGDSTGVLISECEQRNAAPADGYYLSVEILASAIQVEGVSDGEGDPGSIPNESAIHNAWGVTPPAQENN